MNTLNFAIKNIIPYFFSQSQSAKNAHSANIFNKNPRVTVSLYEMQTISNALFAYAKMLEQKHEEQKAKETRGLEKRIFEYLRITD